jgi:hypothetical protein
LYVSVLFSVSSFFVVSISTLYAEIFEEFYILPMGQGNAQLVIYAEGLEFCMI